MRRRRTGRSAISVAVSAETSAGANEGLDGAAGMTSGERMDSALILGTPRPQEPRNRHKAHVGERRDGFMRLDRIKQDWRVAGYAPNL